MNRTIALVNRFRPNGVAATGSPPDGARALLAAIAGVPAAIDGSLDRFDFRGAVGALWNVVTEANRYVSAARPWELGRAADAGADKQLDAVLAVVLSACRTIARELGPFLPDAARRIQQALDDRDAERGRALFPKS